MILRSGRYRYSTQAFNHLLNFILLVSYNIFDAYHSRSPAPVHEFSIRPTDYPPCPLLNPRYVIDDDPRSHPVKILDG